MDASEIQDNLIFLNHHSLSEGKYLIFYIFDGSFLDNIILKYKYIYNSFFFYSLSKSSFYMDKKQLGVIMYIQIKVSFKTSSIFWQNTYLLPTFSSFTHMDMHNLTILQIIKWFAVSCSYIFVPLKTKYTFMYSVIVCCY